MGKYRAEELKIGKVNHVHYHDYGGFPVVFLSKHKIMYFKCAVTMSIKPL
jgi:hypothetical protein